MTEGPTEGRNAPVPVARPADVRLDARAYGTETAVSSMRAAVGAVPVVGTLLTEVLFDFRSRIKQRRFEAFMASVTERVARLDSEAIDRAYLESEEFSDFAESLILRVLRTRDRSHTARLRDLFVREMGSPSGDTFNEAFLDLAAIIHEDQLTILRSHRDYAHIRTKKEWRAYLGEPPAGDDDVPPYTAPFRRATVYGMSDSAFRFLVQDLMARGLMFDNSAGYYSTKALDVVDVTEYGRAFLDFMDRPLGAR